MISHVVRVDGWTRRNDLKRVGNGTLLPARGDLPGPFATVCGMAGFSDGSSKRWVVASVSKKSDRVPGRTSLLVGEVRTRTWHFIHDTRFLPGLISPTVRDDN